MLSNFYTNSFTDKEDGAKDVKIIVNQIRKVEKQLNKSFLIWDDSDLQTYLKSFNATSPVSLNKYMVVLRRFADYVCENQHIKKREFSLEEGKLEDYINKDALLKVTISYEQYINIKEQLTLIIDGVYANVRDKLIFEFAWSGLTSEEIKTLKVSNIEFSQSEDLGYPIAKLKMKNGSVILIEDSEIVDDIKLCIKEDKYVVNSRDGKTKFMSYRDSEYLLKPVNVGRNKKDTNIDNPSITLQNIIKNQEITCEGIDMENLSIENIRRSRLIYLLSPQNKDYFDVDTITELYNLKNGASLYWLKNIARQKYGNI